MDELSEKTKNTKIVQNLKTFLALIFSLQLSIMYVDWYYT